MHRLHSQLVKKNVHCTTVKHMVISRTCEPDLKIQSDLDIEHELAYLNLLSICGVALFKQVQPT